MEDKIKIYINNKECFTNRNSTILEACKENGFNIPTFCHIKGINEIGACRICLVEVKSARSLMPSCSTPVKENMSIITNSQRVLKAREMNYQFLIASHSDCLSCYKNGSCDLQKLGTQLNINKKLFSSNKNSEKDETGYGYIRDNQKCILCQKCVSVCENIIGVNALSRIGRSHQLKIGNSFNNPINNSVCIQCGRCVMNCPTGALTEKDNINEVLNAINNKEKFVVVQTAPAVRAALGEGFGLSAGTLVTGKMVEALKLIGFDKVLDTTLAADFTIMEEGFELLGRIENNKLLPQFTSCCPAWVKFVESFYPEILPNLSTAKSPQQMFGALIKSYYPNQYNIDPKNIINVSIMPCTAKKYECNREEINSTKEYKDIDYVLTTRELIKLIKQANIDFLQLEDSEFDELGIGSGAGDIFGATGGVMEAALRTAYEVKTGKKLDKIEFEQIRGDKKVKEGSIFFGDKEIKFLVVTTPKEAIPFIEDVINGKSDYHFIEVMTCPGGCIGGGGQPIPTNDDIIKKRMNGLYNSDYNKSIRRSYENPIIKQVYDEFLEKPLSKKAEKYLHTYYINKKKF